MRGKYRVERIHSFLYLLLLEFFSFFFPLKKEKKLKRIKKILLCNTAQMGDVILSTIVLPNIKEKYPDCKIGFLCGSWAHCILKHHPSIDWIHLLDHWKLNRRKQGISCGFQYVKTLIHSFKEIRNIQYDYAIDLYSYYPNSSWFLWWVGIPYRIGYVSGGMGRLYTQGVLWKDRAQYIGMDHLQLLKHVFVGSQKKILSLPKPKVMIQRKAYIILHPGTWDPNKLLPIEFWQKVILKLKKEKIFLTGKGEKEKILHEQLFAKNVESLCDALDWEELLKMIYCSKALICVDSMVAHISAAYQIPSIVFFSCIEHQKHWFLPQEKRKAFLYDKNKPMETLIDVALTSNLEINSTLC